MLGPVWVGRTAACGRLPVSALPLSSAPVQTADRCWSTGSPARSQQRAPADRPSGTEAACCTEGQWCISSLERLELCTMTLKSRQAKWSFDIHFYNGIFKSFVYFQQYITMFSIMFASKRARVNHIAFFQQACKNSPSPGMRWLWHSCKAYLSLAEGHGQEQQLSYIIVHRTSPWLVKTHSLKTNCSFWFLLRQKKWHHSSDKCLTIWKYILGKIAIAEHPLSQLRQQKLYFFKWSL